VTPPRARDAGVDGIAGKHPETKAAAGEWWRGCRAPISWRSAGTLSGSHRGRKSNPPATGGGGFSAGFRRRARRCGRLRRSPIPRPGRHLSGYRPPALILVPRRTARVLPPRSSVPRTFPSPSALRGVGDPLLFLPRCRPFHRGPSRDWGAMKAAHPPGQPFAHREPAPLPRTLTATNSPASHDGACAVR